MAACDQLHASTAVPTERDLLQRIQYDPGWAPEQMWILL